MHLLDMCSNHSLAAPNIAAPKVCQAILTRFLLVDDRTPFTDGDIDVDAEPALESVSVFVRLFTLPAPISTGVFASIV